MNSINVLCWVFAYIGYLFLQSFVINGIKLSADGETVILPDGSEQDSSMILYPLQKYMMQFKMRKIFFKGEQFDKLWEMLKHKYINIIPASLKIDNGKLFFSKDEDVEIMKKLCYVIERDHDTNWQYDGDSFSFYKEFRQYRFNKYLRMPVIQCIKCMSSFWSTVLTFLPVMIYFFGLQWWLLPLWLINIFALTYLNKLIYRSDV